jgi:hypothetical protein
VCVCWGGGGGKKVGGQPHAAQMTSKGMIKQERKEGQQQLQVWSGTNEQAQNLQQHLYLPAMVETSSCRQAGRPGGGEPSHELTGL